MKLKINLSLAGSIANGLSYIGALKYFEENKDTIEIKNITGCSFGAVIASAYSCGISIDEMVRIIKKINLDKLSWLNSKNILQVIAGIFYSRYILYPKLKKIFKEIFNWNKCNIPLILSATLINNHGAYYLSIDKEISLDASVCASMCMPILFPCKQINGMYLVDGSFTDNFCSENLSRNDYNIILLPTVKNENIKINIVNKFINLFQSLFSNKSTISLDRYIDKIDLQSGTKHFFDFSDEAIINSIRLGYLGTKKYFEEKILKHL